MTWFTTIKTALAILSALNTFRKEYEAMGVARLSPEMGKRDRRRLQSLALDFIDKKDVGLRRMVKIDDAVGPYLQALLDSEWLNAYLTGSTLEREQARAAILAGSKDYTLQPELAPGADRAKP